MSTTYPSSKKTFNDPSGTTLVTDLDHAQLHTDMNDTVEAIQDTIGTTAGTNVLIDFSAGEFPARVNSGGTIVQTLTGGTINSGSFGTPTVTLGSDAEGDILYRSSGGTISRLAVGSNGQVLTTDGTVPSWGESSSGSDGWTSAGETWTYASAQTFTVSGDVTSKYSVGTRIKFTQTSVKYAVVIASSYGAPNTTVTIATNTDYTIANAAITSPYYSYQLNPQDYPGWFETTAPTWDTSANGIDDGSGGQPTTTESRIAINGRTVYAHVRANGTKVGSNAFINFAKSVYPSAANSTDRSCIGSAYCTASGSTVDSGNVGTVMTLGSNFFLIFSDSITDNTTINDVSFFLTYEM